MPALRLSYHHLPLELRQCFAYFAAFPKDHKIEKEELIYMWIAHCYISSKGTLGVEDVGNEICNELILRSLFQSSSKDEISMHDLVHDLAESVMENKVPGVQMERNITTASSTIRQVDFLRRYIMFPKTFQQDIDISSISELRSLRILDANRTGIKYLPSSIGRLKHLRYLNLSVSEIRTLPSSLCSLWNLQMLNLDYCNRLVALPKNMRYLRNLQHLCLSHCTSLSEMPSNMGELTQLRTLSMFIVGADKGNQLEELGFLNLSGRLEIQHLERVKGHMEAKRANLADKLNLRDLILSWERNNLSKLGEDVDEMVLEALEPHPSLEELSINGFSGRRFPVWMTNSTLGKIVKIDMKNCINCRYLPKLGGLPHLKALSLQNVGLEYIIEDEVGSGNSVMIQFLALEQLYLIDLPNLKGLSKEQESKEAFPNLKQLYINRCSSLVLPPLLSLKKLEDLECSSSTLALFSEVDTLTRLGVMIEEKMTCFALEKLAKLTNLRWLKINGANEISVPVEGLETLKKLEHLCIENCERMRCVPEALLRHLTALKALTIESCPKLVDLPEEIKHLHNLKWIVLLDLPKMASLPEALQHLSSLRSLYLDSLPELESVPDGLDKLTGLSLVKCEKLVSLPPAIFRNLNDLIVGKCPELQRRCKRGSGEYWHNVAHIPSLQFFD